MTRNEVVDAVLPSPKQVLDLIVASERHRKFVWTAGRVLKEGALWSRVESLGYGQRKLVLSRVTSFLEDLPKAFSSAAANRRASAMGTKSGSTTFTLKKESKISNSQLVQTPDYLLR